MALKNNAILVQVCEGSLCISTSKFFFCDYQNADVRFTEMQTYATTKQSLKHVQRSVCSKITKYYNGRTIAQIVRDDRWYNIKIARWVNEQIHLEHKISLYKSIS